MMINKNSFFLALISLCAVTLWTYDGCAEVAVSENKILNEYIIFQANHSQSDEMNFLIDKIQFKILKAYEQNMPNLYQMVHNLAKKLKIATPEILIYEGNATVNGWNAFALSLYHNLGTILIGQDLIQNLLPAELEAVIAHELGHISGNHSLKRLGVTALLSRPSILKPFFERGDRLFHGLLLSALTRYQERQADQSAADIIDNPQSLGNALDKMENIANIQKKFCKKRGRLQKTVDFAKSFFSTHPSSKERKKYIASRANKRAKN